MKILNCATEIRNYTNPRAKIKKNLTKPFYGFSWVPLGGESEIRTRATAYRRTNPLAGGPLIASWVFLRGMRGYAAKDSVSILTQGKPFVKFLSAEFIDTKSNK